MEEEPLEDDKILLIIDSSEGYSCYAKCVSVDRQPGSLNTSPGITCPRSKYKDTHRGHL